MKFISNTSMVEATYKGHFIEVQLHIDVHFEKYGFFLSLVYKFLPFIEVQKLPQA